MRYFYIAQEIYIANSFPPNLLSPILEEKIIS